MFLRMLIPSVHGASERDGTVHARIISQAKGTCDTRSYARTGMHARWYMHATQLARARPVLLACYMKKVHGKG